MLDILSDPESTIRPTLVGPKKDFQNEGAQIAGKGYLEINHANGVLRPSKQKLCRQINHVLNFCWKIYAFLSSHSVKTLCREMQPLVSEYHSTLGIIVTSWCNDGVGNINSTEKFYRLALRFSKKFLQRVGKWLLADTIPNFYCAVIATLI